MRTSIILLVLLALSTLGFAAQQGSDQKTRLPAFEVASIRHNTSGDTTSSSRWLPGRFAAVNARLDDLVLQAFGIPMGLAHILLDGGVRHDLKCLRNCSSREEILSARFDIQATTRQELPPDQQSLVLRGLLIERFKLMAHLETRAASTYVLTVAREGRLGPKLRASSHDCGVWARAMAQARIQGGPIPSPPTGADGKSLCGGGVDAGRMKAFVYVRKSAGPISVLIDSIRGDLPFQIIDRTGLAGNYEWELTSAMPGVTRLNLPQNAPTIEDALQEQLGLRLVRSTEPLEVLVIDSVSMPAPN